MPRCVTEPEQWNGRNDAGAHEQDRQPPAAASENHRARMSKIKKKNNRERDEQNCFDEQTRDRGRARFLSEQSVKSERETKGNRNPRKPTVAEGQIQHAERGEQNRRELPAGETFAQKNRAEENVHQWRHEIAETCFDNATDVDRVNEEKPVRRDGESAGQAINSRAR